jgi:hypothetical protein
MPEWPYDHQGTYECAFCGQVIDHAGWDPCEITVRAARDVGDAPGHWVFWAHAPCVPASFSEDLRVNVQSEYEPPGA